MRRFEQWMTRYGLLLVLLLGALVLLLPLILRIGEGAPVTPRAESYLPLRHAALATQGIWTWDPLEQVEIVPSADTALLAVMLMLGVPWLLPVLLALIFLVLLDRVLVRIFGLRPPLARLSLLVLVLSPLMSVLGTGHSSVLLALVLFSAGLLLLERYPLFSLVAFALSTTISPLIGVCGAFGALIWQSFERRIAQIIYTVVSVVIGIFWISFWSIPEPIVVGSDGFIFEFGASAGVSMFLILLAFFAIVDMPVRRRLIALGLILLTCVVAWYVPTMLPIATIVLSVYAAQGLLSLFVSNWDLDLLRQLVLILLCCVALFLVIVSMRERITEQPSNEFSRAMIYLSNQHRPGAVLTDPAYANLVEYFSTRKVTPSGTSRVSDAGAIFHSRNANDIYSFLESSSTSYIFMTGEMRERLFSHSDEGLLFLLPNTGRFVLVYDRDGSQVWYYIKR